MNGDTFLNVDSESEIIKETTAYTASSYASQAVLMLRGFLIARVLGPSLYGVWTIMRIFFRSSHYLSCGTTSAMVRQVPYEIGRGNKDYPLILQQNSISWHLLISSIVSACVFILSFTDLISNFTSEMRIMGIVFILHTIHLFIPFKLISEKKILLLSKYNFCYAILNTIFGISLLFPFRINGLLAGMALSHLTLIIYLLKRGDLSLRLQLDQVVLKDLMRKGFPIIILFTSFFLMYNIDKIIVFILLGSTMTGYYGLASFISGIINFIPVAVTNVLLPRMMYHYGRTQERSAIEEYFTKPIVLLSGIIPIILGLIFININIIIIALLPQYIPSITVLQILIIGLYFAALWGIPTNMLIAFNKQKKLMWLFLGLVMLGALLDITIIIMGIEIIGVALSTVLIFLIASVLTNAYTLFSLRKNVIGILFTLLQIYAPFFYMLCGLGIICLIDVPNKIMVTNSIRSLLFVLYSIPLIVYVNKQTDIINKIVKAFKPSKR